jgi:hypothetical protein
MSNDIGHKSQRTSCRLTSLSKSFGVVKRVRLRKDKNSLVCLFRSHLSNIDVTRMDVSWRVIDRDISELTFEEETHKSQRFSSRNESLELLVSMREQLVFLFCDLFGIKQWDFIVAFFFFTVTFVFSWKFLFSSVVSFATLSVKDSQWLTLSMNGRREKNMGCKRDNLCCPICESRSTEE